jgi:hypothetical protein
MTAKLTATTPSAARGVTDGRIECVGSLDRSTLSLASDKVTRPFVFTEVSTQRLSSLHATRSATL